MEGTQMKHTPGPWTYAKYADGDNAIIGSAGDERICEMITNEPDDVRDANGNLIRLAPELAEELRYQVEQLAVLIQDLERIASPTVMSALHRRRDAARAILARLEDQTQTPSWKVYLDCGWCGFVYVHRCPEATRLEREGTIKRETP